MSVLAQSVADPEPAITAPVLLLLALLVVVGIVRKLVKLALFAGIVAGVVLLYQAGVFDALLTS